MTVEELYVFVHGYCTDKSGLNWCCCGRPEDALQKLLDILENIGKEHPEGRAPEGYWQKRSAEQDELFKNDSGLMYMTLYWLNSMGLSEHGGSVGGGWLTDRGEEVLRALRAAKALDPQDVEHEPFETFCASRCIHGFLTSGEDSDRHKC